MDSAFEITSGADLLQFELGTVWIKGKTFTVLTGFEAIGGCFWCGGELEGKQRRYCKGHRDEYYRHFDWSTAGSWARKRAGNKCENCGIEARDIPTIGPYFTSGYEVHHIVDLKGETRQFTAFNLPWNLICLCHNCHLEVHAAMRPPPKLPPDSFERAIKRGQLVLEGIAS